MAVRRLSIESLAPDIKNALIIGVIIAKQDVKNFTSKKDGADRGVWNFTVRDSPTDTINVNWWGSGEGAMKYSQMLSIGDVVEIINPRVLFIQPGDAGTRFRPAVSSPFQIELQEFQSDLIPHVEQDTPFIRELMHMPTKPQGDYLRLSDVIGYGKSMQGQHINLLVALIQVSSVRSVVARKTGQSVLCRELVLLDETERDFCITIWNEDILHWVDLWKPRHTVIFFADIKVNYNDFKQAVTANISTRTVITIDPDIPQAHTLRAYVQSIPTHAAALLDQLSDSNIELLPDTIMTSAQVLDKAYSGDIPGGQFSALVFAYVTLFDIDGSGPLFTYKCSYCGMMQDEQLPCPSVECGGNSTPQNLMFSLRVNLTDHRGTLLNIRLTEHRAVSVLGCTEDVFMAMTDEERTQLKWKILLQRCAARIMVLCSSPGRLHPMISLLSCIPADNKVVSAKLPIY